MIDPDKIPQEAVDAFKVAWEAERNIISRGIAAPGTKTRAGLAASVDVLVEIHDQAVHELTEALRLTVEYIGIKMLPPVEGWSWYDALKKYAPEKAAYFEDEFPRS